MTHNVIKVLWVTDDDYHMTKVFPDPPVFSLKSTSSQAMANVHVENPISEYRMSIMLNFITGLTLHNSCLHKKNPGSANLCFLHSLAPYTLKLCQNETGGKSKVFHQDVLLL